MNEERRLIYHWRLFTTYFTLGFRKYKSSEFEQWLQKDFIIDGETI